MTSIIKVDQIQTAAGGVPTAADLGLNVSGNIINISRSETSTRTDNTSSSWVSVWAPTYTPIVSNSTIIIQMKFSLRSYRNSGADGRASYKIYVNNVEKAYNGAIGTYDYGGHGIWVNQTHMENVEYDNTDGGIVTAELRTNAAGAMGINHNEVTSFSSVVFIEVAQ